MAIRTLIVDDQASFRIHARELLEEGGFTVIGEADSGRAGLDQAEALRPDLVLVDVRLPDIEGFSVAACLSDRRGGPAVVLTSTLTRADFGRLAERSGARGFIPKLELSAGALRELLE